MSTIGSNQPSPAPVFISYRRADSEATTGRIADRIAAGFGSDAVFRDVDSIIAGQNFPEAIQHAVERCEVVLVAIGKGWLDSRLPDGTRRIDDLNDFVRLEIEGALRTRKRILPLLIDGASMPASASMPQSIRPISSINALNVRAGADFESDITRLIEALKTHSPGLRARVGSTEVVQGETGESSIRPLLVGAATLALALGLLWLMVFHSSTLVRWGLAGNVWFVLLFLLGLSAAGISFALFKFNARYAGKVLNGKVELGGPPVVMLLVLILGFFLPPSPLQQFDFTVFLHGPAGRHDTVLRGNGTLSLDLGTDRRTESVGNKGEVRFVGIPASMRDQKVSMALDADKYELADFGLLAPLNEKAFYAPVRPKQLSLSGRVIDMSGRAIEQARIQVGASSVSTDEDGRFEVFLPADLPESERRLTVTANGYETWREYVVPGSTPLEVPLDSIPTSGGASQ